MGRKGEPDVTERRGRRKPGGCWSESSRGSPGPWGGPLPSGPPHISQSLSTPVASEIAATTAFMLRGDAPFSHVCHVPRLRPHRSAISSVVNLS